MDVGVWKSVRSLWIECVSLHDVVEKEWPRDLRNPRHWMINEPSRKETVTCGSPGGEEIIEGFS